MSLSPQKVDFEATWSGLQEGVAKIVTLTGVSGMPMIEYVLFNFCTKVLPPFITHISQRYLQALYSTTSALLRRPLFAVQTVCRKTCRKIAWGWSV